MDEHLTPEQKAQIAYKKQSRKWLAVKYGMWFMPAAIVAQVVLSYYNGPSLPLEIICSGCFGLMAIYFGVNYFQKKELGSDQRSNPSRLPPGSR